MYNTETHSGNAVIVTESKFVANISIAKKVNTRIHIEIRRQQYYDVEKHDCIRYSIVYKCIIILIILLELYHVWIVDYNSTHYCIIGAYVV